VIKGGSVRTLGERNLGSMLPRRLRVRSGVDYCAPPIALALPTATDRCCAFGVYVSDIPITLIQEVVGSHAIYGGNNVELVREYIVACRSHAV